MQSSRHDIPLEAASEGASIAAESIEADDLDRKATVCLCMQQLSSSFSVSEAAEWYTLDVNYRLKWVSSTVPPNLPSRCSLWSYTRIRFCLHQSVDRLKG